MAVGAPPSKAQGYASEHMGWSASLVDVLETLPELQWPESVATYARMRTDPQLTAVLNAYTLPLRQAPKHVDPAGCRDEVVQLVADDFGLPILGSDEKPGPARRRGVRFSEHFRLALLSLIFGHMPFAIAYEIRDGKARLNELAERMPSTITDILTTDDGKLDGILQFGSNSIIPARNLLWYVHDREGSQWQGRSMLRSAYGAWLLKHEMWRVLATSNRRFGMGVPNVQAPPGATDAQLQMAASLASSIRAGDQAGIGLPHGFTVNLAGITGSTPDTLAFIRYLDSQMAQMALASVLNLDASPNGSRALGDTFVNLMLTSLNAIGDDMAATLTGLAIQMVDYNFGEDEAVPRIVIGDAGSRPEVTAEAINALLNSGAITADPSLETWVRERYRLPEREEIEAPTAGTDPDPEGAPEDAQGFPGTALDPTPTPVPTTTAKRRGTVKASDATKRRKLTQIEAASGMDPEKLDQQWGTALDDLLTNWDKISREQRKQIAEQISAAVSNDKVDALALLAVDSEDAAKVLAEALHLMARDAATQMKQEARKQGVSAPEGDIDTERLTDIASAVASIMASGLANAAGREALRIWTPDADAGRVAEDVDEHLKGLSDSYLRDQLGNALSAAQNMGRHAVLDAAPSAKYFASEILDDSTCKKCREIDGEQFKGLKEAGEAYASGGYVQCLGRLRCRGIVVAVWDD